MNMRIKNPLSLFAVFISAMYAVATVAFRDGLSPLRGGWERMLVIGFIVLFPFVLLGVITYLVINHYDKIFSPEEYKSLLDCLLATNDDLSRKKIEEEVTEINDAPAEGKGDAAARQPADALQSGGVSESGHDGEGGGGASQLPSESGGTKPKGRMTVEAYRSIEARAVGELSRMYGISFIQGAVLEIGKRRVAVDAVGHRDNVNYVVEVKYWKNGRDALMLCEGLGHFLAQRSLFRKMGPVRMVVAVVLDRPELSLQKEVEEYVLRQSSDATLHFIYREQA